MWPDCFPAPNRTELAVQKLPRLSVSRMEV